MKNGDKIKYLVYAYKGKETIPTVYKFYTLERADEFVEVNRHTGHVYVTKKVG